MAKTDLTPEYLRELFSYDPHEGLLRWKLARSNNIYIGKVAGYTNMAGYRVVMIDNKNYHASRLIWTMTTGAWPKDEIDHINGVPSDNRLSNLREASRSRNMQNLLRARKDNALGILGVSRHKTKFVSFIRLNGKSIYLGLFATPELAHAAYIEAKRRLHHLGNTL